MKDVYSNELPKFDLEEFMVSMSYSPEGMTTNLARQIEREVGKKKPVPVREADILDRALQMLPIGIYDDDVFAGNYGPDFTDTRALSDAKEADEAEFTGGEGYRLSTEDEKLISGRYLLFGVYTLAHTCLDYELVINKGLKYLKEKVKDRLAHGIDEYGESYLKAMLKSIGAVQGFAARYLEIAEEKLENCKDAKRRAELERMIAALEVVPYEPAQDFYQALQSMWIIHTTVPAAERSWASISLGRMDMFLLPFYEKWLKDGHTREEAIDLIVAFFKLLDSYGDGSCALNFGPDFNELTKTILDAEKKAMYRSPIVDVRMREDTPDEIYDQYVDKDLFYIGQPTFYGEDINVKAMEYRGMSDKDGHSINSCMGMVVVGKEIADMWGCCVNMNIPLELAINKGKPLMGEFPEMLQKYLDDIPVREPDSIEAIKKSYEEYMQGILAYVADQNKKKAAWMAMNRPNPLLSLMLDDCIMFGRDRAHAAFDLLGDEAEQFMPNDQFDFEEVRKDRGVRYHNVTVLSVGFAHAADAIGAIDELVFQKRKYTLDELMEAARNNYEGSEKALRIFADLRKAPKYANGSDYADSNASFVLDALADACEEQYVGNIRFIPTCHTIDANVKFGRAMYASLDGRKDGEAVGKNAGPVLTVIKSTPTDFMNAAAQIPNIRYSGGVPIDIYVTDNILQTKENRDKFRGLMRAYFKAGGMQVQVNSVNIELLKKAYEEPENHPHVIVRKGGFSLYFTDLDKDIQKDMIDRFEKEIG